MSKELKGYKSKELKDCMGILLKLAPSDAKVIASSITDYRPPYGDVIQTLDKEARGHYDQMSPYSKEQYRLTLEMSILRKALESLEAMKHKNLEQPNSYKQAELSKISLDIRKRIQRLDNAIANSKLCNLAKSENKQEDFNELLKHINNTKSIYQSQFRVKELLLKNQWSSDTIDTKHHVDRSNTVNGEITTEVIPPANRCFLREDDEFQLFFQSVTNKNIEIDTIVDTIAVGVTNLKKQTLQIREEVTLQTALLAEAEDKVEHLHGTTHNINVKLRKVLKEANKDMWMIYMICLIFLIFLIGYILSSLHIISV